MPVEVGRANRWDELVGMFALHLGEQPPGVFERVEVLVSSKAAGRLLRQGLAGQLPSGVCAGIEFLTPTAWTRGLALTHDGSTAYEHWHSPTASLVAARALSELSEDHAILGAHLAGDRSPVRRQHLAQRSVHLFNHYTENAPDMVSLWLAGEDVDALGVALPEHLTWQPALLRLTAELLGCDPVHAWRCVAESVAAAPRSELLHVFAVPEVTSLQTMLLRSVLSCGTVHVWRLDGTAFDDWTSRLGVREQEGPTPTAPRNPEVEVIGSHGPARMVEVLREELCHRFETDPGLEPRDVVVVCDEPDRWRTLLATAFMPTDTDPEAHPGRALRLWPGTRREPNLVAEAVHTCLRLSDARATVTELTRLMLLRPLANRWRLSDDKDRLLSLASAAGIRWGLGKEHRRGFGMAGITQNTWFRGIDRLLAGLTLAPSTEAGLGISGVAEVGTSDLDLLGAVAEIVSRLRRFNHEASTPATAADWSRRLAGFLDELVECTHDDAWMIEEVSGALTDLSRRLSSATDVLSRSEYALLFEQAMVEPPVRAAVGNGNIHVIGIEDLAHVDFRLVCLLGVADTVGDFALDSVDLGPTASDPRRRRLAHLLGRARACDQLLVVTQTRDALTNQEVSIPTTVSWLLRELGHQSTVPTQAPSLAHSEDNFVDGTGFDRQGLAAAQALRRARSGATNPQRTRRRRALALPSHRVPMEASVAALASFLADPAREFLRSAAGVRLWEGPQLVDEMPFIHDGLEAWQLRDRLLDAFRRGMTPEQAARRESELELLPPGRIGRRALDKPLQEVVALWKQAHPMWVAPVADHRVQVDLGDVVITDTLRTRGGQVVSVTVSDGRRTEIEPWLTQLVLAAQGISVPAVVHRLDRHYSDRFPSQVMLPAPGREVAREILAVMASAYAEGRSRLVPLPQDLGLAFCEQLSGGTWHPKHWEAPASDWRNTLWRRFGPSWRLFYDGVPHEVFTDAATDRDPAPPAGHTSSFAAWAAAVYLPLVGGVA